LILTGLLVVCQMVLIFIALYSHISGVDFYDMPGKPFWFAVHVFLISITVIILILLAVFVRKEMF
jgi:hypothetical protein